MHAESQVKRAFPQVIHVESQVTANRRVSIPQKRVIDEGLDKLEAG